MAAKKKTTKKAPAKKAPAKKTTAKAAAPRRAVVVAGVRTPFVKAFSEFMLLDTIALADAATKALLDKTQVPRSEIDGVVWGGVILNPGSPNIAREVALDLNLPAGVEGYTVTRACASGLQAVTSAVAAIERGDADVIIAGGSDSTSNASVALPNKAVHALAPLAFGKAKGMQDYLGVLSQLMPINEVLPSMPKIAERTTGEVMGESAEKMARRNGVTRQAQDALAARSHRRAAEAVASGRFEDEITPVETAKGWVHADTIIRGDTSEEKLARLRPVFAKDGTVTAGNATPLTDGAACVLLMSEEEGQGARLQAARGLQELVLRRRRSERSAPHRAGPRDAEGARACWHGAVGRRSRGYARGVRGAGPQRHQGAREQGLRGGAPWAAAARSGRSTSRPSTCTAARSPSATPSPRAGARMVTTMANELANSDKETAVLGICAAGGLGAAAVMERV